MLLHDENHVLYHYNILVQSLRTSQLNRFYLGWFAMDVIFSEPTWRVLLQLVLSYLCQRDRQQLELVSGYVCRTFATPSWGVRLLHTSFNQHGMYSPWFYLREPEERQLYVGLRTSSRRLLRWTFMHFNVHPHSHDLMDAIFGKKWHQTMGLPREMVKGRGRGWRDTYDNIFKYLYPWF